MTLQIVLNTQKNLFLNQAISKKILAKIYFQKKNLKMENIKPSKKL